MPELEAWQSVIITGTNGDMFLSSAHGPDYSGDLHHPLSCQHCHGGQPNGSFSTMEEAHVGVIPNPSEFGNSGCLACHDGSDALGVVRSACDGCHSDIVTKTSNSLHTTQQGYFTSIEQRGGHYQESMSGYFDARCADCHTSCGQCHVTRPQSVGGGFMLKGGTSLTSHRFYRTPDMNEQCTACHGTRVGDDYQGVLTNNPDLHYNKGMNCVSCHTAGEIHGDGTAYGHMYEVAGMPRCEDCHTADIAVDTGGGCAVCHVDGFGTPPTVPQAAIHHAHHVETSGANCGHCHDPVPATVMPNMQCQACHSQPYKNCSNCHEHTFDSYEIDPSTIQFKIARNPSPHREEYDISVVRQVAVSPETYANWGITLTAFEDKPTWLYSSPHNIRISTLQTAAVEGESCSYSCHQSATGFEGVLLRAADLGDPGTPIYNANIGIVIPDGWPSR
ncbi:MAG: hypothetical protein LC667_01830 [Thioalkalivibrio sp.]|nr:hypothetical protein [Thioalkalivibrio sp.]